MDNIIEKLKEQIPNNRPKCFCNIMPIENIPSVMQYGILSHDRIKLMGINSISVASKDVQSKREIKKIPGAGMLHSYANLYLDARNPMLYKICCNKTSKDICILKISLDILKIPNVIISDMNAASSMVSFNAPYNMFNKFRLDFEKIYMDYWNTGEELEVIKNRFYKCAEVLVPNVVNYHYIIGAICSDNESKNKLIKMKFDKDISVNPYMFFYK